MKRVSDSEREGVRVTVKVGEKACTSVSAGEQERGRRERDLYTGNKSLSSL